MEFLLAAGAVAGTPPVIFAVEQLSNALRPKEPADDDTTRTDGTGGTPLSQISEEDEDDRDIDSEEEEVLEEDPNAWVNPLTLKKDELTQSLLSVSNLEPGMQVLVTGAGSSQVNGTYTAMREGWSNTGMVGGKIRFKKNDETNYFMTWYRSDGSWPAPWYLEKNGTKAMYVSMPSQELSLPLIGWQRYGGAYSEPGELPGPTIIPLDAPMEQPVTFRPGKDVNAIFMPAKGSLPNASLTPAKDSLVTFKPSCYASTGFPKQ